MLDLISSGAPPTSGMGSKRVARNIYGNSLLNITESLYKSPCMAGSKYHTSDSFRLYLKGRLRKLIGSVTVCHLVEFMTVNIVGVHRGLFALL